jgi:hypothetical protein
MNEPSVYFSRKTHRAKVFRQNERGYPPTVCRYPGDNWLVYRLVATQDKDVKEESEYSAFFDTERLEQVVDTCNL